jgi:hypothetical protein
MTNTDRPTQRPKGQGPGAAVLIDLRRQRRAPRLNRGEPLKTKGAGFATPPSAAKSGEEESLANWDDWTA